MNENRIVKGFLSQLRKFLPEKVIYEALSVLPEDIFDNEELLDIPTFRSDREIYEFIKKNGFENSENLACFFMEQYLEDLNAFIDELLDEMDVKDERLMACAS